MVRAVSRWRFLSPFSSSLPSSSRTCFLIFPILCIDRWDNFSLISLFTSLHQFVSDADSPCPVYKYVVSLGLLSHLRTRFSGHTIAWFHFWCRFTHFAMKMKATVESKERERKRANAGGGQVGSMGPPPQPGEPEFVSVPTFTGRALRLVFRHRHVGSWMSMSHRHVCFWHLRRYVLSGQSPPSGRQGWV